MNRPLFANAVAVAAIAFGSIGIAQAAHARTGVYFSIGVPMPAYVESQPVYVPQPEYAAPPVVYDAPQVVYDAPAPVYVRRGDDWRWRQNEWRREEWRREQWHRQHEWREHERREHDQRRWGDHDRD
jgi:hypothetical protein